MWHGPTRLAYQFNLQRTFGQLLAFQLVQTEQSGSLCVSLWVLHTLGGGIAGVYGTGVHFPGAQR